MKLKDIILTELKYQDGMKNEFGKLINVKYSGGILEFQTPRVIIVNIDEKYITLQLTGTEACKTFYLKILELESNFTSHFKNKIKTIFKISNFVVKIPKNGLTVIKQGMLFNYHHLTVGMEIICLVSIQTIWITNEINYNLTVKEILIKDT